jgi:hypothetical protein
VCTPGAVEDCYDGPAGTEDVGRCRSGKRTCLPSGTGFGPCLDQVVPEPEVCATSRDENCDGVSTCGDTVWSRRLGGPAEEAGAVVASDADGNVYVAGYYREPIDLGGGVLPSVDGSRDLYVLKLDPGATHLWSTAVTTDGLLTPRGIAVADDGSVVVAAAADGTLGLPDGSQLGAAGGDDIFLLRLAADGSFAWAHRFGDAGDQNPGAVAIGPGGTIALTGWINGTTDFGGEPIAIIEPHFDAFLATFAADGRHVGSRAFTAGHDQVVRAMAVDADGAVVLTGQFEGFADFGGGPVPSAGDRDVFVAKLDADGEHVWTRTFGGPGIDRPWALALGAEGEVAVTGQFADSVDFGEGPLDADAGLAIFVVDLDAGGSTRWSRRLGGPALQSGYGLARDSLGRLVLSGFYDDSFELDGTVLPQSGAQEPAILLVKLETDGSTIWARGIRVTGDQTAAGMQRAWRSVAMTPDDSFLLTGYASGGIDFGDASAPLGDADILIAKLAP